MARDKFAEWGISLWIESFVGTKCFFQFFNKVNFHCSIEPKIMHWNQKQEVCPGTFWFFLSVWLFWFLYFYLQLNFLHIGFFFYNTRIVSGSQLLRVLSLSLNNFLPILQKQIVARKKKTEKKKPPNKKKVSPFVGFDYLTTCL